MNLIRSVWPKLNKQDKLSAYLDQLRSQEFHQVTATVTETICLTVDEWDEFKNHLLSDREWLAGKGGSCDEVQHHSLLIVRPGETPADSIGIYVDPQGYNYARYVGFYLSPENLVTNPPDLPFLGNCMDSMLMGQSFKDRVLLRVANC